MIIRDVRAVAANRFLYVLVETDAGITGLGECGTWGFLDAAKQAILSFREYLIGKDPLHIEHHFQSLYRCFHFRGAAVMGAISAIDIALWDIAGKHYGVPVYRLLGGPCRSMARVYAHVGGETTEELLESCLAAKERGYTAVGHLSPFLDEPRSKPWFESYAGMLTAAAQRVGRIREALGEEMDLCLELHRRLKPAEAIAFAHMVEPYTPFFLEDPIVPDNFDSMALVAARTAAPIATGERILTIEEFSMLFARNAMAYARVSVCACGGITGAKKVAAIAEAHGISIVPHNPLSPVSSAACLQIAAAVENFAIMELPDHSGPAASERFTSSESVKNAACSQSELVDWLPTCENGFVRLPEAPGIGVALRPGIEEKFPYQRREINTRLHIDGSVVDQ